MFSGKSILVTGGTGSFGQHFIRTLLERFDPKRVVVYSRDELKQYEMQQNISSSAVMRYFLGDVRDNERLTRAMQGIDYVVHAAALKQVPAAEYNPIEFIRTNVQGAENVVKSAIANNVEKVIALSTDKAVEPVNLYGATKMLSDRLFISANNISGSAKTRFSVVRYGNVVGSRGSVVPLYQSLIAKGEKKLPLTNPNMTRFWITLKQGVDFVINCFNRMDKGGGGEIFIPKMPSVNIIDVATALAPQAEIDVVGIRPGEKLHESLCSQVCARTMLEFKDFYLIKPEITFFEFDKENILEQEDSTPVDKKFTYTSNTNPTFLSVEEIRTQLANDPH